MLCLSNQKQGAIRMVVGNTKKRSGDSVKGSSFVVATVECGWCLVCRGVGEGGGVKGGPDVLQFVKHGERRTGGGGVDKKEESFVVNTPLKNLVCRHFTFFRMPRKGNIL